MNFKNIIPSFLLLGGLTFGGCGNEGKKPISENLPSLKLSSINQPNEARKGFAIFYPDGRIITSSEDADAKYPISMISGLEGTKIEYTDFKKGFEEMFSIAGLSELGNYYLNKNSFGNSSTLEGISSSGIANSGSFESASNENSVYGFSAGNNSGLGYSASSLSSEYNSIALNQNGENPLDEKNNSQSNSSKVPEPGTLTLFGVGTAFAYISRKLKRK